MDTLELHIKLNPKEPWGDILIAELAELGFEGFTESEDSITAYGPSELKLDELLPKTSLSKAGLFQFELSQQIISQRNWNEEWESNFPPVYVEDYASILAPFHTDEVVKGMKVLVQPQMSFGTGHHQTTWMMVKFLFEMPIPSNVLDMGTGTGVLAIIAEKRGAENILAIDIEEWSAENAELNARLNDCNAITVRHGDVDLIDQLSFGLIIANINKNVLKAHMSKYAACLEHGGILLLSGFFATDVPEMETVTGEYGLRVAEVLTKDEWAAIKLIKTN